MISKSEIEEKAKEFKVNTSDLQRDYVFGWLLKGIFTESELGEKFILKGGNALRKAYLKNTRFSKDLDFSVLEEIDHESSIRKINEICKFVQDKTGVEFEVDRTRIDEKPVFDQEQKKILEARVYFKSFYGEEEVTLKIQLDLTQFDKVLLPVQDKSLLHPYSDQHLCVPLLKVQKLEEILASKLDTLIRRRKVSDLFDLVYAYSSLSREYDLNKKELITTFLKKTIFESTPSTAKNLLSEVPIEEFRPLWAQIIAPAFSLFDFDKAASDFKEMITILFSLVLTPVPAVSGYGYSGYSAGEPSYFSSNARNTIIKAGQERTLLNFLYDGINRLVEPYEFEYRIRKSDGRGMEYFWAWDNSGGKSGKIGIKMFIYDKIQSISPTDYAFTPRFPVQL